jgi:hypothetical protein
MSAEKHREAASSTMILLSLFQCFLDGYPVIRNAGSMDSAEVSISSKGFVKKSHMFFGNFSKQEGWRHPNISWISSPFWHHCLLLSKLFFVLQEVLEP